MHQTAGYQVDSWRPEGNGGRALSFESTERASLPSALFLSFYLSRRCRMDDIQLCKEITRLKKELHKLVSLPGRRTSIRQILSQTLRMLPPKQQRSSGSSNSEGYTTCCYINISDQSPHPREFAPHLWASSLFLCSSPVWNVGCCHGSTLGALRQPSQASILL